MGIVPMLNIEESNSLNANEQNILLEDSVQEEEFDILNGMK